MMLPLGRYKGDFTSMISKWFVCALMLCLTVCVPVDAARNAKLLEQRGIGVALAVCYTADDNILVGGVNISLIDGETGEVIRQFFGHDKLVTTLKMSPDGKTFLSVSKDKFSCLWDLETGQLLKRFSPKGDNLSSETVGANYTPDGSKVILALYQDTLLQVYDIETDTITDKFETLPNVMICEMTNDGSKLLMSFREQGTRLMDFESGEVIFEVPSINAHDISPDGSTFTAIDEYSPIENSKLTLRSMEDGSIIQSLPFDSQNRISHAAFTPDGNNLLVYQYYSANSSPRMTFSLLDANNFDLITEIGQFIFEFAFHHSFSNDGSTLLISNDTELHFWNLEAATMERSWDHLRIFDYPASFSPDGSMLITFFYRDYNFRLHDSESLEVLHSFDNPSNGWGQSVAFSPDGSKVITAPLDTTASMWDVHTGEKLHELNHINRIYFSPDGETILIAGNDLQLWDTNTGNFRKKIGEELYFHRSECFSPDGLFIYLSSQDMIRSWSLEEDRVVKTFETSIRSIQHIQLSPDGSKLAVYGYGDKILLEIIDLTNNEILFTKDLSEGLDDEFFEFSFFYTKMVFSPDGSQLFIYEYKGLLLDSKTGHELLAIPCIQTPYDCDVSQYSTPIQAARFSPNNNQIITANRFGVIQVWENVQSAEESGFCLY